MGFEPMSSRGALVHLFQVFKLAPIDSTIYSDLPNIVIWKYKNPWFFPYL